MYNLLIKIYTALIHLSAPFNQKAKEWVNGRKGLFPLLEKIEHGDGIVWFNCASLGEYEQAIPLIINLKRQHPNNKILVTFFSPSGYNHRRNIEEVDYYAYLPADTKRNASRFLDIVKPVCAIFCKYDYWFNFIKIMYDRNIPQFFVSSIFRESQYFFKWYGYPAVKTLRKVTHFFVQNEESKRLLNSISIDNVSVTGDTRFDRVVEIANSDFIDEKVSDFKGDGKVFIAGSSWEPDETIIHNSMDALADYRIILAPHLIDRDNLERISRLFDGNVVNYSQYEVGYDYGNKVMVIDCIGKLAYLYRYADIAYVGGGFGKGIHNTLEAVVYGIPVIFGPKYLKYNEAVMLVDSKGGFSISNESDFRNIIEKLSYEKIYSETKNNCLHIVQSNSNVSRVIILEINKLVDFRKSY